MSITYHKYIRQVLGKQFYNVGMTIPLVKEAIDLAKRLNTEILTCTGNACFSGDTQIWISTDYPLALQLSGFVHEMVHIKQKQTLLQKRWNHMDYLNKYGIGKQIKFMCSAELLPYKLEIETLNQIPEKYMKDKLTIIKKTHLNSYPLKMLPYKIYVGKESYPKYIYRTTLEAMEKHGLKLI